MKTSNSPETFGKPIWKELQYKLVNRLYNSNSEKDNTAWFPKDFFSTDDESYFWGKLTEHMGWLVEEKATTPEECIKYGFDAYNEWLSVDY